jgi:hypothetical protein
MRRALLIAMLTAAAAAPAAGARPAPPDPVSTGTTAAAQRHIDLRSPARDAGGARRVAHTSGRLDPTAPGYEEIVHSVPVPQAQATSDRGFQWGDAGIGAASMLGVVGIVAGVAVLLTRRRRGGAVIASH